MHGAAARAYAEGLIAEDLIGALSKVWTALAQGDESDSWTS
jgi:hypothetical protein